VKEEGVQRELLVIEEGTKFGVAREKQEKAEK